VYGECAASAVHLRAHVALLRSALGGHGATLVYARSSDRFVSMSRVLWGHTVNIRGTQ
jgi:hypothetical protein